MTRRDDDEARAVPVTLRNKEDEEVSSLDTCNETADGDYDVPLDKGGAFLVFGAQHCLVRPMGRRLP